MAIERVVGFRIDEAEAHVPPLSDYDSVSEGWREAEFRAFSTEKGDFGGLWRGEPGEIAFEDWPYNEICVLRSGRVAIVDDAGGRREFGPGDAFFIPAGFAGRWVTLEPSEKVFVAITR